MPDRPDSEDRPDRDVDVGDMGVGDVGADDVDVGDVGADDVGAGDVGADDVGADDLALEDLLDDDRPLTPAELAALAAEEDDAPIPPDVPAPTPSFTARVMKDVETRKRTWWQRVGDTVWRTRILRFNVATLVPLALIGAIVAGVLYLRADDAPRVPAAPEQATAPTKPPPLRPAPDETIAQFSLAAPDASRVAVVGDFNGWDIDAMALDDADGDGVWTLAIPLPRGRYAYMFVVDGTQWIIDPDAKATQPDAFGGDNALLRL